MQKQVINKIKFALIDTKTGNIKSIGELPSISHEWGLNRYKYGNPYLEVREVQITERRALTREEVDQAIEKYYGDQND